MNVTVSLDDLIEIRIKVLTDLKFETPDFEWKWSKITGSRVFAGPQAQIAITGSRIRGSREKANLSKIFKLANVTKSRKNVA